MRRGGGKVIRRGRPYCVEEGKSHDNPPLCVKYTPLSIIISRAFPVIPIMSIIIIIGVVMTWRRWWLNGRQAILFLIQRRDVSGSLMFSVEAENIIIIILYNPTQVLLSSISV